MNIICDTNVWYLLHKEPEYEPESNLILTAANYFDWYASDWMNPKHIKHSRLLNSYRAAKLYNNGKIIIDPWDFSLMKLTDHQISKHTQKSWNAAEECLDQMLDTVYNTKQINSIRRICSKTKYDFVTSIKENNKKLFKHCSNKSKSFESQKYKLKKKCVIRQIKNWMFTYEGFDGLTEKEVNWKKLDKFISTYYKFLNNKTKSPKPNSMVDLSNFLYLTDSNYIYWSEEKEFLELVRQSYGQVIPAFIYPEGKMVKKIFNL